MDLREFSGLCKLFSSICNIPLSYTSDVVMVILVVVRLTEVDFGGFNIVCLLLLIDADVEVSIDNFIRVASAVVLSLVFSILQGARRNTNISC